MEIDGSMSLSESDAALWNSDDIVLITYADSIISESRTPLETLKQFVDRHLKEIFFGRAYFTILSVQFRRRFQRD